MIRNIHDPYNGDEGTPYIIRRKVSWYKKAMAHAIDFFNKPKNIYTNYKQRNHRDV